MCAAHAELRTKFDIHRQFAGNCDGQSGNRRAEGAAEQKQRTDHRFRGILYVGLVSVDIATGN